MLKALRNKKGVTLVELLAVVVILGIIAAIAVPTIGGLIARQQEKADIATLQNIISSAKTYATAEEDDIFTLAEMGSYIDLGSNTVGTTSGGSEVIYIKVAGSVVSFHSDAAGTVAVTTVYVNETDIATPLGVYTP